MLAESFTEARAKVSKKTQMKDYYCDVSSCSTPFWEEENGLGI
jgi:hypothetical protein